MKRMMMALLLIGALLLAGCVQFRESSGQGALMPEVNPYAATHEGASQRVTLYFPLQGEPYLAPVNTVVEVQTETGDTLQEALIRALMAGPTPGLGLEGVFVEDLHRVSMTVSGDVLTLELSRELLTLGEGSSTQAGTARLLRLYALVNTLCENTNIARVQILVAQNNGRASAPTREQVGLDTEDGEAPLGPLGYSNEWVVTAQNVTAIVFESAISSNAGRMLRQFAPSVLLPDAKTLQQRLQQGRALMVNYKISNLLFSADSLSATAYVDVTYELMDGTQKQQFNQPVALQRNLGVWKVEFSSVESLLFP